MHWCTYNAITGIYQKSAFINMINHILVYYSKFISMDVSNGTAKEKQKTKNKPFWKWLAIEFINLP